MSMDEENEWKEMIRYETNTSIRYLLGETLSFRMVNDGVELFALGFWEGRSIQWKTG